MSNRTAIIISALAVAAMCCLIFCMSAAPGGDSGALSLKIAQAVVGIVVPGYDQMDAVMQATWLDRVHFLVRKGAHFTEYAVLGAFVANLLHQIAKGRATGPATANRATAAPATANRATADRATGPATANRVRAPRRFAASWALSTAYAATDELHQLFVDGRAGMLGDVCIDSAGAAFGALVFMLAIFFFMRNRSRSKR